LFHNTRYKSEILFEYGFELKMNCDLPSLNTTG
jgi:hypothetical protein